VYLNLTNEVAIELMTASQYPDEPGNPRKVWQEKMTPAERQLWEDRAESLIANLRYRGIKVEEA
jgi:hypothetical protein